MNAGLLKYCSHGLFRFAEFFLSWFWMNRGIAQREIRVKSAIYL